MRRLKTFSYFEPTTIEEAVRILRKQGGQARPIAGAIFDAVEVRVKELPITPERLLAAIKEKRRTTLE